MNKATKWAGLIIASAVCATSVAMFAACDKENEEKTYTVTYYDADQVLKAENVKENGKATEWTPVKDDYNFDGWYGEPTFAHAFDFDTVITANTSVFAKFSSAAVVNDTREYYLCGAGSSNALGGSSVVKDEAKLTKASDSNVYTITVDLYANDWFQFVTDTSWNYQRGWGYMSTGTLDGVEYFASSGGIDSDTVAKKQNILCKNDGNYTFTLTTHPADDLGHPLDVSASDTITWTYNGAPEGELDAIVRYYLKGESITGWGDYYNDATELKETETAGVYSMEVYLKENDTFMFTSTSTKGGETEVGSTYIQSGALDAASLAYVSKDGNNMIAKASGMYTLTYNSATASLSVSFNANKTPVKSDYYVDGTFGEGHNWTNNCFNDDYKLVETEEGSGVYELNGIELNAGTEFTLQAFVAGSEGPGDTWENLTGNYNFKYYKGASNLFEAANPTGSNYNYKVLVAGTYNLSFDSYSKILTIKAADAGYDIYINGEMQGATWPVSFDSQYKFTASENTKNSYELVYTFAAADENKAFGFKAYPEDTVNTGDTSDWIGVGSIGTSGTANDLFKLASNASNFVCTQSGTYKIVISYDGENKTVDFYAVTNE